MTQPSGITVHMIVEGKKTTMEFPEAINARIEGGSLIPFKSGPTDLGAIASGLWTHWTRTGE